MTSTSRTPIPTGATVAATTADPRTVVAPEGVDPVGLDPAAGSDRARSRRLQFRAAVADLAARSTADDLIRWMLVPGSLFVVLGFGALLLGWLGAARTPREIEQIPYLISGGLVGLALVVLGGLLLVSTFWVAVLRKLQGEAEARAEQGTAVAQELAELRARLAGLEAPAPAVRRRSVRASTNGTGKG
jgi:hypothetical protein